MSTATTPSWPKEGDVTATAAVFFLAGLQPQRSLEDYAEIVQRELIDEQKRLDAGAPSRSALMRALDGAEALLLRGARAGRVTLYGRLVDDILGAGVAAAPFGSVPKRLLHMPVTIDLRRNRLEPDVSRPELTQREFEHLWHEQGADNLRVAIEDLRRLQAPPRTKPTKPEMVRAVLQDNPDRFPAGLSAPIRDDRINTLCKERFGVNGISASSIKQGLRQYAATRK